MRSWLLLLVWPGLVGTGLFWSGPAFAGDRALYSRATRLVEDYYLKPTELDVSVAFEDAAEAAEDAIPWLIVHTVDGSATLIHGMRGEIATIRLHEPGGSATLADLPEALSQLEDAILDAGEPLPPDVELPVVLLRGAAGALDRHSVVLAGSRLERFDERLSGRMSGIGARVGNVDGQIVIKSVYAGSPAQLGGLRDGDVLLRISGASTQGMSVSRAVDRIRGPVDSEVVLTVRRASATSAEELSLTLRRAEVIIPNVTWERRDSGTGLIAIENFSEQTETLMRAALVELTTGADPVKGLILDLRGNTGGSMIQSQRAADLLLEDGLVVRTVGRGGDPVDGLVRELRARDDGQEPDLPLVVLVDPQSASASEILAGSLKLLGRAALIGERTYGKGTVQKVYTLREGDDPVRFKLTVAEYRLDGDVAVAGVGLDPDLWVLEAGFGPGRVELPEPSLPQTGLLVSRERPGWRASGAAEDRGDLLLTIADQVLLASRASSRRAVLDAATRTATALRAQEDARLMEIFAAAGLDWRPADAHTLKRYPQGFPIPPPPIQATVTLAGPARAGDEARLVAVIDSDWANPLYRARLRITSEDADLPWNDVILPIGLLPAKGHASAVATVALPVRFGAREDKVSLVLEADGLPSLPMGDWVLAAEGREPPPLSLTGHLTPDGDHMRAELSLENHGTDPLSGLMAHFEYPDDARVELIEPEASGPDLAPGASGALSLALRLPDGLPADDPLSATVAMDLVVEAEFYGEVIQLPIVLPRDGSLAQVSSPTLRVDLPSTAPAGPMTVAVDASDPDPLDDLTVWYAGEKIAWLRTGQQRAHLDLPVTVSEGTHSLVVRARDAHGVERRQVWYVRGTTPDGTADR